MASPHARAAMCLATCAPPYHPAPPLAAVASCPAGQYANLTSSTCDPCPDGCSACTALACSACSSGYSLLNGTCGGRLGASGHWQ
jgi:hypothetical protein